MEAGEKLVPATLVVRRGLIGHGQLPYRGLEVREQILKVGRSYAYAGHRGIRSDAGVGGKKCIGVLVYTPQYLVIAQQATAVLQVIGLQSLRETGVSHYDHGIRGQLDFLLPVAAFVPETNDLISSLRR